jgi:hypothetical protein
MFTNGIAKVAGWGDAVKSVGSEAIDVAKRFGKGFTAAGGETFGSALKLKGRKHLVDAAAAHGGLSNALKSKAGRADLAEAVGKASPTIGAAGGYAYGLKKVYDKTIGNDAPYMPNNYESYGM